MKSKRGIELSILATEDISRDKRSFREATRRISNLLFLKDVLEEIMKDFLEPAIYHRLDNSIFNLKLLEKVACNDQSGNKEILMNILEIVALISSIEPRIVQRVADVAVYFLMDRLFTNLYRQN